MLQDRVSYFTYIFTLLQNTNSRNEKELIVKDILPEYKEDFDYIVECLAGKHKFGYRYYKCVPIIMSEISQLTVKGILQFLQTPYLTKDLSVSNIAAYVAATNPWYEFFEPIVNRTLRLGIGNSLIEKEIYSPMLAKKLEDDIKLSKMGYYVTEKLDGNRCIASYDGMKWNFTSRNGKPMHVDFDMSAFDKRYAYDGEILSFEQTENSNAIADFVKFGIKCKLEKGEFNETSGLINRHSLNKNLVFNVFDVIGCDEQYRFRRDYLNSMANIYLGKHIRILPTLGYFTTREELLENIPSMLDKVTSNGGEGLMINLGDSEYLQKRTDKLLKVKKVYTMDMRVEDVEYGNGKYEGLIGALICKIEREDGTIVECKVGTGLSDEQRLRWSMHPENIINKIVEVSYFSLSQSSIQKGSKHYSLRFPRLKGVRNDKNNTSED